jgi:hypothetical protein
LHDTYLYTKERPQSSPDKEKGEKSSSKEDEEKDKKEEDQQSKEPRIHIQIVQSSVSYSHVLSLIPLIHGVNPSAPEAKVHLDPKGDQPDAETKLGPQGNGSPFPEGYPIKLPAKGSFDLVVHIGVGSRGAIVVEKLGHKRGYQIEDVENKKAPIATDQTREKGQEYSEAEQRELARMNPSSSDEKKEDVLRGFGKGYEDFKDEEHTSNDLPGLVEWLQQECNLKHTRLSHDAGRYLCDYIVSACTLADRSSTDNFYSTTALCARLNEEEQAQRCNSFMCHRLENRNRLKSVQRRSRALYGGSFVDKDAEHDTLITFIASSNLLNRAIKR